LLIAGLTSGHEVAGLIAFVAAFVFGIAAIAIQAKRRWPDSMRDKP
jgi:hypothetical protein